MDNKALEEFFAKASDMLSDWNPDPIAEPDVMHAKAPEPGTEHELAPAGESYYEQRAAQQAAQAAQPALPTVCPSCGQPDCPVSLLMELVDALGTAGQVMLVAALAAEYVREEQAPTEES